MNDLAENIVEEPKPVPEIRRSSAPKPRSWLNQALTLVGVFGMAVAWALTVSSDLREVQTRLQAVEESHRQVERMVLQNRLMTLEIAKVLAQKVDAAMEGPDTGLPGVDFAIKQAQDDLDRLR